MRRDCCCCCCCNCGASPGRPSRSARRRHAAARRRPVQDGGEAYRAVGGPQHGSLTGADAATVSTRDGNAVVCFRRNGRTRGAGRHVTLAPAQRRARLTGRPAGKDGSREVPHAAAQVSRSGRGELLVASRVSPTLTNTGPTRGAAAGETEKRLQMFVPTDRRTSAVCCRGPAVLHATTRTFSQVGRFRRTRRRGVELYGAFYSCHQRCASKSLSSSNSTGRCSLLPHRIKPAAAGCQTHAESRLRKSMRRSLVCLALDIEQSRRGNDACTQIV